MARRQTWEPDVCQCAIQYSYHGTDLEHVFDVFVKRICSFHAALLPLPLETLHQQMTSTLWSDTVFQRVYIRVLADQRAKDGLFTALMTHVPKLQSYFNPRTGDVDTTVLGVMTITLTPGARLLADITALDLTSEERQFAQTIAMKAVADTGLTVEVR